MQTEYYSTGNVQPTLFAINFQRKKPESKINSGFVCELSE